MQSNRKKNRKSGSGWEGCSRTWDIHIKTQYLNSLRLFDNIQHLALCRGRGLSVSGSGQLTEIDAQLMEVVLNRRQLMSNQRRLAQDR